MRLTADGASESAADELAIPSSSSASASAAKPPSVGLISNLNAPGGRVANEVAVLCWCHTSTTLPAGRLRITLHISESAALPLEPGDRERENGTTSREPHVEHHSSRWLPNAKSSHLRKRQVPWCMGPWPSQAL